MDFVKPLRKEIYNDNIVNNTEYCRSIIWIGKTNLGRGITQNVIHVIRLCFYFLRKQNTQRHRENFKLTLNLPFVCTFSRCQFYLLYKINHTYQLSYLILENDDYRRNVWKLARAVCVRCHGTKCPLLTAFFLLPSGNVTSLRNFAWAFNSQKNKIWGKTKFGGPPLHPGGSIF